jgi:hypothetical protein
MRESKFMDFWSKWGYIFPFVCGVSFIILGDIFLGITNLFLSLSLYISKK